MVLDIFDETFDLNHVQRMLNRIKKETKDKTPPVTVVFNKWDLVDVTADYGFDVKAMYDLVFDVLDKELTPQGYASLRTSVKENRNVTEIFETAATNYFRWGKGTNDVLQDVSVGSVKKPKSKKKDKKKKDKPPPDAPPGMSPSPKSPVKKDMFAEEVVKPKALFEDEEKSADDAAASDAPAAATPRKRRTGGKKTATDHIQNAAKQALPQQGECTLS